MQKPKVLIAGCDPETSAQIEALLKSWGYDPLVVADTEQAREELRFAPVRVCILDWGRSGRELCWYIKSADFDLQERPYVLALVPNSRMQDLRTIYCAGAADYAVKPVESEDLHRRMRKLAMHLFERDTMLAQAKKVDPIDLYRRDLAFYHQ